MPADTTFEGRDYEFLAGLFDGFEPSGLGTNYAGIFDEGDTEDEALVPSGDRDNPLIYGHWAWEYTHDHDPVLDSSSPPVRRGRFVVLVRIETGPNAGFVLGTSGLFAQLRQHAEEQSTAGFTVLVQDGRSQAMGFEGDRMAYALQMNFIATG